MTAASKYKKVEAGYYVRKFGLRRRLEVVHLNDTLADKMHVDRWVARCVNEDRRPWEMFTIARCATKREAVTAADNWYTNYLLSSEPMGSR